MPAHAAGAGGCAYAFAQRRGERPQRRDFRHPAPLTWRRAPSERRRDSTINAVVTPRVVPPPFLPARASRLRFLAGARASRLRLFFPRRRRAVQRRGDLGIRAVSCPLLFSGTGSSASHVREFAFSWFGWNRIYVVPRSASSTSTCSRRVDAHLPQPITLTNANVIVHRFAAPSPGRYRRATLAKTYVWFLFLSRGSVGVNITQCRTRALCVPSSAFCRILSLISPVCAPPLA